MRINHKFVFGTLAGLAMLAATPMVGSAQLLGPTPYLSFNDSPFNGGSFSYFYLENFEDHLFNVPGVTASEGSGVTSVVFGPDIHDSVDADDGVIDGFGLKGDSFFSSYGGDGITFRFNAGVLGALPTHAGIVWTDGSGASIAFEAFDENGASLGTVIGNHSDGSFSGQTAEDRFYGVVRADGVSAIKISNVGGGIEVDHLQYGRVGQRAQVIPEPGTCALFAAGLLPLAGVLARRRKAKQ